MRFRSVVVLACVPFASVSVAAQGKATTPIGIAEVRRLESALADDSMEGRLTGAPGGARAARYIANEMARIGLTPEGDSGFYQRVPVSAGDSGIALRSSFTDAAAGKHETAYNLLGLLKGSDPTLAREIIVVDAHYDHLGIVDTGGRRLDLQRRRRRRVRNGVRACRGERARARHAPEALDPLRAHDWRGRRAARHLLAPRSLPGAARQRRRQPRDGDDRSPRLARGRSREGVAHGIRSVDDGRDAAARAHPDRRRSAPRPALLRAQRQHRVRASAEFRRTRCRRSTCTRTITSRRTKSLASTSRT